MTFADFEKMVNDHLSVESVRRGTEVLRKRQTLNAMINLQRFIIPYQVGHKTIYTQNALEDMGSCQMGDMPPNARPTAFYIYSELTGFVAPAAVPAAPGGPDFSTDFDATDFATSVAATMDAGVALGFTAPDFDPADFTTVDAAAGSDFDPSDFSDQDFATTPGAVGTFDPLLRPTRLKRRNRLDYVSWMDRQSLINGERGCRDYVYTISPHGRKMMIFPRITDEKKTRLLLYWDGIKEKFAAEDVLHWPEAAAEAVAMYVLAKINRDVNKNIQTAREYERDWVGLRLALYREAREMMDAEKKEEETISVQDAIPPET